MIDRFYTTWFDLVFGKFGEDQDDAVDNLLEITKEQVRSQKRWMWAIQEPKTKS